MNIFNVYSTSNIEIVKGKGSIVIDNKGKKYLDFYGGHAVISIGHSHPYYIKSINKQIKNIGYYSNSIKISKQKKLAKNLGKLSNYENYNLFLCNSGSEAVENALKIASFYNKKNKVISFNGAFHGRTSGALSVTDNIKIISPFNNNHNIVFLKFEDLNKIETELKKGDISSVIIEGIQGLSGIIDPGIKFFKFISELCNKYNVILILDEVQSGYGRSGNFFAHQLYNIYPDIITVAKGMGNGFPIGGVLISPKIKPFIGMLGTTFGGNYLACTAGLSVLHILEKEKLIENSKKIGKILFKELKKIKKIKMISGRGLMIGLYFNFMVEPLKNILLYKEKVFVGTSTNPYVLRILPPLSLSEYEAKKFIEKLIKVLDYFKNE